VGSVAAMHHRGTIDVTAMLGALFFISVPMFVTGPFAVAIFALWLRVLPVGGWGTWRQAILPACCLAAPYLAYVARLMRNSLLEVLKSDFMRTARAKGVDDTTAVARHALKVAILPVVTFLGPMAAYVLTGSFVVESVFNIAGAGSVFVNSIQNRDMFLLVGAVAVYCVLLVFFNFIVDLCYGLLDKRIKVYG
jgi:oligopeptide transport system permease protein